METRFTELKNEILKRAKEASACKPEYGRAYKSESFAELMQVIKDNFGFAVRNGVIEPVIIENYKDEFNTNQIYCNVDCSTGYLLVSNATVEAYGNAYISSYYTIECKLSDNAVYRIRESNTIRYTSDNIKFERV